MPASGEATMPSIAVCGCATSQEVILIVGGNQDGHTPMLAKLFGEHGVRVDRVESFDEACGELSDDALWEPLCSRVKEGVYAAAVLSS